jgi:hypothetical protein
VLLLELLRSFILTYAFPRNGKCITEKEYNFLVGSMIRLTFQTIANAEIYQLYEKHVNHNTKTIEKLNDSRKDFERK